MNFESSRAVAFGGSRSKFPEVFRPESIDPTRSAKYVDDDFTRAVILAPRPGTQFATIDPSLFLVRKLFMRSVTVMLTSFW